MVRAPSGAIDSESADELGDQVLRVGCGASVAGDEELCSRASWRRVSSARRARVEAMEASASTACKVEMGRVSCLCTTAVSDVSVRFTRPVYRYFRIRG